MLSSLRGRLLVSEMVTLILFVCMTAWALDKAFVASVERAAEDRLMVHVYSLLAAAESVEQGLVLDRALEKTRFNRQESALYGYVIDRNGGWVWRSASSLLIDTPEFDSLPQGVARFGAFRMDGEDYYAVGLGTFWESGNTTRQYTFYVMESQSAHRATIDGFRSTLWQWLSGLTLALLVIIYLVTRWGLRPLQQLAAQMKIMQSGESDRVAGEYPQEIQQVVDDLNTLLAYEQKQREKYKNSLADLAHSLKTPLAVLRNASGMDDPQLRALVDEQTRSMDVIVQQQLRRAISKGAALWSKGVPVRPVIDRIGNALLKAYQYRSPVLSVHCDEGLLFPGEEGSCYEIVGNLLENAFKYGGQNITVTLSRTRDDVGELFRLIVEDDGPGIPPEQRSKVFLRGERLDTRQPGQGIGLAMVAELVGDLGGRIRLESGLAGGARFQVEIPAA